MPSKMASAKDTELTKLDLARKIGSHIKLLRADYGITQAELARRCGKDSQHIELIENGKVSANAYTLYIIAMALEVSLSELVDF